MNLYNQKFNTHFVICELSESPDVKCIDTQSKQSLFLEITLLENLHGDIAYELGKGKEPISPTTHTTVVDFFKDVLPFWRKQLEKKLLARYDENVALILRQVSILWDELEWECITPILRSEIIKGRETHYGAGIWVICTDNHTWPSSKKLFCVYFPGSNNENCDLVSA